MHEASLVQGLLKLATESLENYNAANPGRKAKSIREIVCQYGLLACFEPVTLTACFEIFAEGTVAENARLVLEPAPLSCQCGKCGEKFVLACKKFACPACGSDSISFKGGNGLVLQAINVDSEELGND